ncbi:uncharacterized protein [Diadema setosum]|uniref:uncharacterized protein n=1 Tax=Diadema setosum TaxID=31175 RepID=UPI003B3AB1CF
MCERFGVPIAEGKTEGPVQQITYLGLQIDASTLQVQVPEVKVLALLSMLREFLVKSKVTLREMQSLIGSLNFIYGQISSPGSRCRQRGDTTPSPTLDQLHGEQALLLESSRARNTMSTYRQAWSAFQAFRRSYHFDITAAPTTEQIALFISYLSWHGYSPNTIATYVSGLSFCLRGHKEEDITNSFPIKHLIEGCRRFHAREDIRCPITLTILRRLLRALPSVCANSYDCIMLTSAFLVAFLGFLRIGEFTATPQRVPLLTDDVTIKGNPPHRRLVLTIRLSKTDQRGAGRVIIIPASACASLCPVRAALNYLRIRSEQRGAFFQQFNTTPLSRFEFNRILRRCGSFVGLPLQCYTAHSFRIGAATSAAMAGYSDEQIQVMGRWASHSYRRYIRLDVLT